MFGLFAYYSSGVCIATTRVLLLLAPTLASVHGAHTIVVLRLVE